MYSSSRATAMRKSSIEGWTASHHPGRSVNRLPILAIDPPRGRALPLGMPQGDPNSTTPLSPEIQPDCIIIGNTMSLAEEITAHLRTRRQLPDVVYHYTTPAGLLGVVSSQRIWATDVRYLNDSSEFHYTLELCRPALIMQRERYGPDDPEAYLFEQLISFLEAAPVFRLYAASFSAQGNLLSQWRAYCPPNGGFSIGITARVLEERSGYKLIPCLYDRSEQEVVLNETVDRAVEAYRRGTTAGEEEPEHIIRVTGIAIEFLSAFFVLAASFKNKSFSEEAEWRLIARTSGLERTPPLFRVGRGGVVPYLELPLVLTGQSLRFDQVIVGPNPHEEIARQAVEDLLATYKVQHDGIELAGIPYRSW